jgi:DNA modification methylase
MNEQITMFDAETPAGGANKPNTSCDIDDIKLYHGDCYELIKTIPDNSVDLVIIDPPYEFIDATGGGSYGNKRGKAGLGNDYHEEYTKIYHENTELGKRKKGGLNELSSICKGFDLSILDELCRVLKKINMYVWCSKGQVGKLLTYFEDKGCFIDILTWHKTNPIPTCNGTYLNDTEYLIFARQKGVKVYGTYKTKFKYYVTPLNQKEKKLYKHPTIKPVFIIENLIVNSCLEGETVLDCFMGSGTTGVACKHTNRKFIGIEVNDEYFEIAKGRINGEDSA